MRLGVRSLTSVVGVVALTIAQLLPAAPAAAQGTPPAPDPNAPPQVQPGYPPPQQPGYPQQQQGYPPPQQGYPPPQQGYPPPQQGYQGYPPPQQGYPPPGYAQPGYQVARPMPPPRPPRRSKGLLIAGPIVLAASYGLTAMVGLQMLSGDVDMDPGTVCINCETVGSRLLIPIIGPWIALPEADGDDGKAVAATLGIAQGVGVLLTIIGISRYAASNPDRAVASDRSRLNFAFVPSKGGGFGMLGGSF